MADNCSNMWKSNKTLSNDTHVLYLNVICELPISYAQPMYSYVVPFLLVVTIIANTLIVLVLSKWHVRTPTNAVLMDMVR
jgi:hypothetical protein